MSQEPTQTAAISVGGRHVTTTDQPTRESLIATHERMWQMQGGQGSPPPLWVSKAAWKVFADAGFPIDRMRMVQDLPKARRRLRGYTR